MGHYVGRGEQLDYVAGSALDEATPVVCEDRIFVTTRKLASGELGSVATEGVFEVTKHAGEAWAFGQTIYWDAGNSRATTTASTHLVMGYAAKAALSAATVGQVLLGK